MIRLRFSAVALALLAAAPLSAAPPKQFDPIAWQYYPSKVASKYVKTEAAKGVKGTKRVFLSAFRMEFVTERNAWVEVPDFASKNLRVRLSGLDHESFQSITDQACQIFLGHLVKQGFDLVMPTALSANDVYREMSEWASTGTVHRTFQDMDDGTGGEVVVHSPAGMPLYYVSSESGGSALNAARKDSPDDLEPVLVHQFDAALVRVTLRVDFLQFASVRKIFRDGKKAVVPYDPMFRVTGRVEMVTPSTISVEEKPFNRGRKISLSGKQPSFWLAQPVVSTDYFVVKSDVQGQIQADGGVRDVTMEAKPEVYNEGVLKNLRIASDLLVYAMKESRE